MIRYWDEAHTPYQRPITTGTPGSEQLARFQALYEQTNPLTLCKETYALLATLWEHPAAASSAA
jgi:hypothetical protein